MLPESPCPAGYRSRNGHVPWLEAETGAAGVRLTFTTRRGGISKPPYEALNLGTHVGDVPERVRQNRAALLKALEPGLLPPVVGEQVHGVVVAPVGALHAGARWASAETSLAGTDALVTATPGLPLVILTADCLPVALWDDRHGVLGAAHAGWRGLAHGVLENALTQMAVQWQSRPEHLRAWIGPAIGSCCYDVGPEVAQHFPEAASRKGDRLTLDLPAAARTRLRAAGVPDENIAGPPACTCCHADLFYSHRRTTRAGGPVTGRQAMLAWLESPA